MFGPEAGADIFETAYIGATDGLYLLAHLLTGCIYLFWNELPAVASSMVVLSLSNRSSPLVLSLFKLHCVVMAAFVLATCFTVTTAAQDTQHAIERWESAGNHTLDFDTLPTDETGFGYVPDAYRHLNFDGLYPFNPRAEALQGKISKYDLNCAVSAPNGLYGARYEAGGSRLMAPRRTVHEDVPAIHINARSCAVFGLKPYFTLHSLKIKPLDIPLSYTTLYLKGYTSERVLQWKVDFPLGFHDVLHVKLEEFSKQKWQNLERLEIYANLHFDGGDWEFCLDDMEIEFQSVLDDDSVDGG